MAIVQCPECGGQVSNKATACPACGAPRKARPDAISSLARVFLIMFVGVPLVIAIFGMGMSDNQTESLTPEQQAEKQRKNDEVMMTSEACLRAQEAVKAALKAPTTANFPSCAFSSHKYTIRTNPEQSLWWVEGYVDSENSFSAMIRSDFIAKLSRNGSEWTVDSVAID